MEIRRLVEQFLKEQDVPPAQFGRWSVRDPRLVFDMRNGREVGAKMEARLREFIANYQSRSRISHGRWPRP